MTCKDSFSQPQIDHASWPKFESIQAPCGRLTSAYRWLVKSDVNPKLLLRLFIFERRRFPLESLQMTNRTQEEPAQDKRDCFVDKMVIYWSSLVKILN